MFLLVAWYVAGVPSVDGAWCLGLVLGPVMLLRGSCLLLLGVGEVALSPDLEVALVVTAAGCC